MGILSTSTLGDVWFGTVVTNSSGFYLSRESGNISATLVEAAKGNIESIPLSADGRLKAGYGSRYVNIDVNDVRLKERTYAKEGTIRYAETSTIKASNEEEVVRTISKPKGSDDYTIRFLEEWPVTLESRRHIYYSGEGINDRDWGGNNLDFAGTTFLYNSRLERERNYGMDLKNLNITVIAQDSGIESIEYLPVRSLRYQEDSISSGIADLKYGLASSEQISLTKGLASYDIRGDQRFVGLFSMNVSLNATTWHQKIQQNSSWAGACEICGTGMDLSSIIGYYEQYDSESTGSI